MDTLAITPRSAASEVASGLEVAMVLTLQRAGHQQFIVQFFSPASETDDTDLIRSLNQNGASSESLSRVLSGVPTITYDGVEYEVRAYVFISRDGSTTCDQLLTDQLQKDYAAAIKSKLGID